MLFDVLPNQHSFLRRVCVCVCVCAPDSFAFSVSMREFPFRLCGLNWIKLGSSCWPTSYTMRFVYTSSNMSVLVCPVWKRRKKNKCSSAISRCGPSRGGTCVFRLGQTSCHRAPIGIVRCSITTGGKSLGASQQGRTKWRTFCYLALLPVAAAAVDWPVGLAKRKNVKRPQQQEQQQEQQ
jgi:hypothetical protein